MGSSVGVSSSVGRHGHRLVYVVVVQSLIIVWLSLWAVEDYLNNIYVRSYVDGVFQAEGWLMILVLAVGVTGSVTGLIHRRNKHSGKSLELVLTSSKGPISTPGSRTISSRISHTMGTADGHSALPTAGAGTAAVSSSVGDDSSKQSPEFHPAVAALKAELSERRVSLGLMSATLGQGQAARPVATTESQTPPVTSPPPANVDQNPVGQRPQLAFEQAASQPRPTQSLPQPSTVIRPVQQSPFARQPQPVPVLKAVQPTLPSSPSLPPGVGKPPDQARPGVLQPPLVSGQSGPRNVTTVITGILPAQKKKDSDGSTDDKQSSQKAS